VKGLLLFSFPLSYNFLCSDGVQRTFGAFFCFTGFILVGIGLKLDWHACVVYAFAFILICLDFIQGAGEGLGFWMV
jgi:hypothetical protein